MYKHTANSQSASHSSPTLHEDLGGLSRPQRTSQSLSQSLSLRRGRPSGGQHAQPGLDLGQGRHQLRVAAQNALRLLSVLVLGGQRGHRLCREKRKGEGREES